MIRLENFVTFKHITLLTKPIMHSLVQRVCSNSANNNRGQSVRNVENKGYDSSKFMIRLENCVTFKHITLLIKPMMHSVVQ